MSIAKCTDIIIDKIKSRDPAMHKKIVNTRHDWEYFNNLCQMYWHDVNQIIEIMRNTK